MTQHDKAGRMTFEETSTTWLTQIINSTENQIYSFHRGPAHYCRSSVACMDTMERPHQSCCLSALNPIPPGQKNISKTCVFQAPRTPRLQIHANSKTLLAVVPHCLRGKNLSINKLRAGWPQTLEFLQVELFQNYHKCTHADSQRMHTPQGKVAMKLQLIQTWCGLVSFWSISTGPTPFMPRPKPSSSCWKCFSPQETRKNSMKSQFNMFNCSRLNLYSNSANLATST